MPSPPSATWGYTTPWLHWPTDHGVGYTQLF